MICLMIYLIISCNSTNSYNLEVSGVKLDAFGRRGNYIDSVDNRINDRIDYYIQEMEREGVGLNSRGQREINIYEKEVRNLDTGIQEIVTALTSAIAGVYCLVKTIINIVKKLKK